MKSTRIHVLSAIAVAGLLPTALQAAGPIPSESIPSVIADTSKEPVAKGKFAPTWKSLEQYQVPDWFRDAKFGMWAHWGPQCEPGAGDWYARHMYGDGNGGQYKFHREKYGHPSEFGFKDVINTWKADKWDPENLVALYKRAGAKYFFAMANHHDNLDMWDSKYQPWNSLRVGPKKDLIAGWEKAARKNGLPFGVSVHAAHAWNWYETSQGADRDGPKAGVPYDGKLTKADGKGKWWDGLDPQDLYAQAHKPATGNIHKQWNWSNGAVLPDQAYVDKFYNRTMDLINRYKPDLVYFDDTTLPLWPVSDAGLKIAAHFYNSNLKRSSAVGAGVLFGKILTDDQRKALVWDVERGATKDIQPMPWQTCTCIGDWHYKNGARYKSAQQVVHMLADVVSKNGNLLLNVPVRGDGTIDEAGLKVVEGIGGWMAVNSEAIYGTRPWKIYGEGPTAGRELKAQGFNEGQVYTPEDLRFTTKGGNLYATSLGWPEKPLTIKALAKSAGHLGKSVGEVKLLGHPGKLDWELTPDGLVIQPVKRPAGSEAVAAVYKISVRN